MTISAEHALQVVDGLSDIEIRASLADALFERRFIPTGLRGDDEPEDLYIALLQSPRAGPVINGCVDVLSNLAIAFFAPAPVLSTQQSAALYHLMRLIGASHPESLQPQVEALLRLVLKPDVPKTIRNPVARAALGYARSENDVKFWEPLISESLIPGLAFKALLQINPDASRIRRHLVDLLVRDLRGELSTSAVTLLGDAHRARGEDERFVKEVITELAGVAPELLCRLRDELEKYSWAKQWLIYAIEEPPRRTRTTSLRVVPDPVSKPDAIIDARYRDLFTTWLAADEFVVSGRFPDIIPGKIAQGIQIFTPETNVGRQEDVRQFIAALYAVLAKPADQSAPRISPSTHVWLKSLITST